MRRSAIWLLSIVLISFVPASVHAGEPPLVDLDARPLQVGSLPSWPNHGRMGGSFKPGGDRPVVASVAGRQAVTMSEKEWMRSTFPAPLEITGGKPFTLALWVYPTRLVGKQVMVSWASRPNDCAEFGYGRSSREGAFAGWHRDAAYGRVPRPSQWHHIAFAYADGRLRVYVDGELDSEAALKPTPKPGEPILLGAAWDAAKKEPAFGFRGSLATVRIWGRALSHREIRNDMGSTAPFDPEPADDAVIEARRVTLRWSNGHPQARSVRLYLAADRAAVEAMAASAVLARLGADGAGQCDAGDLTLGKTSFWRVEQLDAEGKRLDAGPVWSFTVSPGPATAPQPRNRVAGVPRATRELAWKPGRYAVAQTVYFGPDLDAVGRDDALLAKALPASATRLPLPAPLEYGHTYYWRVDEDNGALPPARGEVWAFRVEDEPLPGHLTFFVVSDTHYGLDPRVEPTVQRLIDEMNFLPGTPLPGKAGGGIVRTPRGVIHLGDITNDGRADQWEAFVRDFGLTGEARLAFPVHELFGNHDGGADLPIRKGILARNRSRPGIAARSANGVHYAWEWEGIRLINLNISVGTTIRPYDPQDSLGFLREELARVKGKPQPVILLHHFGFDKRESLRWWSDEWRKIYYDTIKDHSIVGIFHGHDHETDIYRWNGIDIFDAPHIRDADAVDTPVRSGFFVVQIADGQMAVAERKLDGTWGLATRKSLGR